jgi:anti-sigma28 factor (negative regulator of flagellin synthesis)
MIISRAEIESAVSAYRTLRKKKAQAAQSVSYDTDATSDVDYVGSSEAASFAEMAASVMAEPMYREALVKDLQQRIAQGKYYVPSEQIVEKLLGRLVLEALPA